MTCLWNMVTCKDVIHSFVLRDVLVWAEIHHIGVRFGVFNGFHQGSSNKGFQITPTELNFTVEGGSTNISITFLHCNMLNIPSIIIAEGDVLPQQVVLRGDVYSNTAEIISKLKQLSEVRNDANFQQWSPLTQDLLIHLEPEVCTVFFCMPIFHQTTYNLYLNYTVYLLCLVGTLICFTLPKCSLWNA